MQRSRPLDERALPVGASVDLEQRGVPAGLSGLGRDDELGVARPVPEAALW